MGDIAREIINFLRREDLVEVVFFYLREHYELLLIAVAVIFIMVLSLWVILERLRKKGWIALIPLYRFVVLFKATGLRTWCAILMLIPGINISMRIVFYIALAKKFNRNYFFVPLLVLLPLIFLPIVAFGEGQHIYTNKKRKNEKHDETKRQKIRAKAEQPLLEEQFVAYEKFEEEAEENVLSMAELKIERAYAQIKKPDARIQNRPMRNMGEKKVVPAKDMMPEMKQGPISRNYHNTEARADRYEKLLKEQEERQRRRELKKKLPSSMAKKHTSNTPNTHLTSSDVRVTVSTTKKAQTKHETRPSERRTRIDF